MLFIKNFVTCVLIVAFSAIAALYLFEGYVRYNAPNFGNLEHAAAYFGQPFDPRTPQEWIHDCRAKGLNVLPFDSTPAINDEYISAARAKKFPFFPLTEVSNTTFAVCKEQGEWMNYETDEFGFFNPPGAQSISEIDVALVGDSYTLGYCVKPFENVASILRAKGLSTLNYGMAGNGPLNELAVFREYVAAKKPHVLFWVFYGGNDWSDLRREYSYEHVRKYLEDPNFKQGLASHQSEIDEFGRDFLEAKYQNALERAPLRNFSDSIPVPPTMWERVTSYLKLEHARELKSRLEAAKRSLTSDRFAPVAGVDLDQMLKTIIEQVNSVTQSYSGHLVLVYLPSWGELSPKGLVSAFSGSNDQSSPRSRFLKVANQIGVPTLDFYPVFAESKHPMKLFQFETNAHYTPEGYQLMADGMYEYLEKSRAMDQKKISSGPSSTLK
jgi:hypothetical protein